MRIDAHHHLWHYDRAKFDWISDAEAELRRDFLPAEFDLELETVGIDASVAVQARCSIEETTFLLHCAAASERIAKVVGWAPLADHGLPAYLESVAAEPLLAGFREIAQDQPADFLLRPAFSEGVRQLTSRGLTYDLLIRAAQLAEATVFADAHPNQSMVLDHAAKPLIAAQRMEPWRTQIRALAERPHVLCKLSGLVTEADWLQWTEADLEPYLDVCLEAFGPDRCMAGSDWPVCLVASGYARWWGVLEAWAARLSKEERELVLGGTAASFYGIERSPVPERERR